MGVSFKQATDNIEAATEELFDVDPSVRSVGITRHDDAYGFRAVRNSAIPVPLNAGVPIINRFKDIPVVFIDTFGEVESLVMVPGTGQASPSAASLIPEVNRHRPLVGGLQIQNFDDDSRQGIINTGLIIIGTLGCFVRLTNGNPALLSNNHVLAGENRGKKGNDRIIQAGNIVYDPNDQIAVLTDFVSIQNSPPGATPRRGNVVYNNIDAGVAEIDLNIASFTQGYLPFRQLIAPSATASARVGDRVFKVGRTTGLTHGEVIDVATTIGPIPYNLGPCWFRRSFTIEGLNGTQFSDKGDSGSAIVRTNGQIVGILYAGNGQQTYACPIDAVLQDLNCTLA